MKKTLSLTLVVVFIATMLVGCSPKNKVTIKTDINGTVTEVSYKTEKATLEDVVVENATELKAVMEDSDYGKFITAFGGYTPDSAKGEYIEILVNDKSAQTGMKEIKINDKDVYTFKVSTFVMENQPE